MAEGDNLSIDSVIDQMATLEIRWFYNDAIPELVKSQLYFTLVSSEHGEIPNYVLETNAYLLAAEEYLRAKGTIREEEPYCTSRGLVYPDSKFNGLLDSALFHGVFLGVKWIWDTLKYSHFRRVKSYYESKDVPHTESSPSQRPARYADFKSMKSYYESKGVLHVEHPLVVSANLFLRQDRPKAIEVLLMASLEMDHTLLDRVDYLLWNYLSPVACVIRYEAPEELSIVKQWLESDNKKKQRVALIVLALVKLLPKGSDFLISYGWDLDSIERLIEVEGIERIAGNLHIRNGKPFDMSDSELGGTLRELSKVRLEWRYLYDVDRSVSKELLACDFHFGVTPQDYIREGVGLHQVLQYYPELENSLYKEVPGCGPHSETHSNSEIAHLIEQASSRGHFLTLKKLWSLLAGERFQSTFEDIPEGEYSIAETLVTSANLFLLQRPREAIESLLREALFAPLDDKELAAPQWKYLLSSVAYSIVREFPSAILIVKKWLDDNSVEKRRAALTVLAYMRREEAGQEVIHTEGMDYVLHLLGGDEFALGSFYRGDVSGGLLWHRAHDLADLLDLLLHISPEHVSAIDEKIQQIEFPEYLVDILVMLSRVRNYNLFLDETIKETLLSKANLIANRDYYASDSEVLNVFEKARYLLEHGTIRAKVCSLFDLVGKPKKHSWLEKYCSDGLRYHPHPA